MPATPERPEVFVHLLPSLIPAGSLRRGIAVVLDVLRATTVMVRALEAGVESIVPCLEVEEAHEVAARLGRHRTILGGERQGLPIAGFDLGNSPATYTPEVCRGKTLVMTTTNGTRAIHAGLEADRVLIASYPNASATIDAVASDSRPVHLVCAGTDGRISLEDACLAAETACALLDRGYLAGNDEVHLIRATGVWLARQAAEARVEALASGRGGRRVREIGLGRDVRDAADRDSSPIVAELLCDPLRIVRGTT